MSHSDYRTLLNRGRKAGLRTSELYSALASRRPESGQDYPGQADSNGYIAGVDRNGQRTYLPIGDSVRS